METLAPTELRLMQSLAQRMTVPGPQFLNSDATIGACRGLPQIKRR